MSAGEKRPWAEACALAQQLANELAVACTRIKAAGSLRRRRPEVGDIEFVVEPRMVRDLADAEVPDLDAIRLIVGSWGAVMKSGDRMIQVRLPDGFMIDIYISDALRWGSTMAIRTGPQDLGIRAMELLRKRGLRHDGGQVIGEGGEIIPTPDEETFFGLAGLPCLPPEERDEPKALRPVPKPRAAEAKPAEPAGATPEPEDRPPPPPVVESKVEAVGTVGALLLIDGSNLAARAYHTMREPAIADLPNRFRYLLQAALERWRPAHLIVALDGDSFRRRTIPGYKSDRQDRDGPSTHDMTEALRPALASWGVATREAEEMEADDVIATLTANAVERRIPVLILTKDTDLLQLVSDENQVRVLWPGQKEGGEMVMDEAAVAAFLEAHRDFGASFPPSRMLDLRVLAGGKDNLPRVEVRGPGLRPPFGFTTKRVAELLAAGVTLDGLQRGDGLNLLKERESTWWEAGGAAALARAEQLRLRTRCTLAGNDASTGVASIRLQAAAAVAVAVVKQMAKCVDCDREIPRDPTFEGNDRCPSCAAAFGQLYAAQVNAGKSPACQRCRQPMDAAALMHGDGEYCTRCGVSRAAGRAA